MNMANVREATLTLKVDARAAKAGLTEFHGIAGAAEAMVGKLTGSIAKLYLTWRAYRIIRESITDFSEFGREIAKVSTVLDAQTLYLLPGYTTAIRKLSVELGESTHSLADGLYEILQAMIAPEKALVVLDASARAAAAGMTSTAISVDAVTTILNAYGIAADRAAKVTSDLYEAALVGKMTYEDVANSIGRVASVAAVAGVSLEELLAAMATLTRAGLRPDMAANALRAVIMQYMAPDTPSIMAARAIGLELGAAELHAKGLLGVLAEMQGKSPEFIAAIMDEARGFTGFAAALQNATGLQRDYNYILKESGQDLIAYEKMMATPAKQFERFGEAMTAIKRNIGAVLAPALAEAATKIADWVQDNGDELALMAQIAENEIGRIKEYLVQFTRYLRSDFGGASRLAWDVFIEGFKLAAKTVMDLALRAGKGIAEALKQGMLGPRFEVEINTEARKRYNDLGYGRRIIPPQNIGPFISLDGPQIELGRPEDPAMLAALTEQVRQEMEQRWIERTVEQGSSRVKTWADATKAKIDELVQATPLGGPIENIDQARDARSAALSQQLAALRGEKSLQQQYLDKLLWPVNKIQGFWNQYAVPYLGLDAAAGAGAGVETGLPTYAAGVEGRLTGENPQERYFVEETIRKINLEKRMLAQTNEERAQSVAIEELEQAALEKKIELRSLDYENVKRAVAELEKARRLTDTAEDIGSSFTKTFDDIILGAGQAGEAVKALLADIARAIVHNMFSQPVGEAIGSSIARWLLGPSRAPGTIGVDPNPALATVAHAGWQVGMASPATRRVPTGLFWGAPRLHGGLEAGEYPAILKAGETVTPAGGSARPSVTVNIQNNSSSPVSAQVKDLKFDLKRMVLGILLEDQQSNGPVTRGYRSR
jgi:TP901 family phage tail tape measure protein